jgi:hypothetical protein
MIAIAVVALLFSSDLHAWRAAVARGDAGFARRPSRARWAASTILPGDPALRLLGFRDQLALRQAAKRFAKVAAEGNGLDNGYSESADRGALETVLTNLAGSDDAQVASAADNMLGILAFADSRQLGPSGPAPVERSVADFQAAIQAEPSNADAKFNLELLLRRLLTRGVRPGSNPSIGGNGKGHRGAGGGVPGRGY